MSPVTPPDPSAPLVQIECTIASTGRKVLLAVPEDMRMQELVDFGAFILGPDGLRASLPSQTRPTLVVPITHIGRPT